MKKALLLTLLVSCFGFAQAQSLSFLYNNEPVGEGDTLTLHATANNELEFAPAIRNNDDADRVCKIHCEKMNSTTTEIMSVCTGLLCKTGYTSAPFNLQGNYTYGEAHIDFLVPQDAAAGLFKITVYDTLNQSTKATMYVNVYPHSAGIAENAGNSVLSAYPNPATSQVRIDYSLTKENATLVIYSMSGRKVREMSLDANAGSITLDVSSFASGIYMYGIVSGNTNTPLKKLVVK